MTTIANAETHRAARRSHSGRPPSQLAGCALRQGESVQNGTSSQVPGCRRARASDQGKVYLPVERLGAFRQPSFHGGEKRIDRVVTIREPRPNAVTSRGHPYHHSSTTQVLPLLRGLSRESRWNPMRDTPCRPRKETAIHGFVVLLG